jgi:hypothetical protein
VSARTRHGIITRIRSGTDESGTELLGDPRVIAVDGAGSLGRTSSLDDLDGEYTYSGGVIRGS